jgi:hypothetical protein
MSGCLSDRWSALSSLDIDLPAEIDDEYLSEGDIKYGVSQPPGSPCQITAFNLWVKLSQIAVFALRTIVRSCLLPRPPLLIYVSSILCARKIFFWDASLLVGRRGSSRS